MALLLFLLGILSVAESHIVISYPGWRGNNLITNATFPYGMQWIYPCGGLPVTQNRTYWPTSGGTIAFQPGWFVGHLKGFLQVNLGLGTAGPDGGPGFDTPGPDGSPLDETVPIVPRFAFLGPSNNPFPGTVCLPNVSLPDNATAKAGDNATIQVVLTAQHGAAIMSCVDVVLVEPSDPRIPALNDTTCFNSTDIGYADLYSITIKEPGLVQQKL